MKIPATASIAVAMMPLFEFLFDFAAVVFLRDEAVVLPEAFFVVLAFDVVDLLELAEAFIPLLFFDFAAPVFEDDVFFDFDGAAFDLAFVVPDDELLVFCVRDFEPVGFLVVAIAFYSSYRTNFKRTTKSLQTTYLAEEAGRM